MGQHVSHSKRVITTRAVLEMCNSLTRTEVLEIAFKLIKDTGAPNAAMLWSSMNVSASQIPQTMPVNHLMESKPSFPCGCWKCHERTVNEFEVGAGVQEVIAYLDHVLDEFSCYFYQTRRLCREGSTLIATIIAHPQVLSVTPLNLLLALTTNSCLTTQSRGKVKTRAKLLAKFIGRVHPLVVMRILID
ncbi:hypothetical protein TcWFU_007560 [Taenia crassiceps]|uniref:Uncharacterized protein n=1 Tax=Taenia crassiceps TaxID=6207 RepID=A0ABR4QM10_9CEST